VKIHDVTHADVRYPNHFCGPAAVSVITGCTAECAVEWYRLYRERRAGRTPTGRARNIRGVWNAETRWVLTQLGYSSTEVKYWPHDERPTLAAFLKNRDKRATLMISYGGHLVVINGQTAVDGHLRLWVNDLPRRRARVSYVWAVTPMRHDFSDRVRALRRDPYPEVVRELELAKIIGEKEGELARLRVERRDLNT
jgi:hypothetical protein